MWPFISTPNWNLINTPCLLSDFFLEDGIFASINYSLALVCMFYYWVAVSISWCACDFDAFVATILMINITWFEEFCVVNFARIWPCVYLLLIKTMLYLSVHVRDFVFVELKLPICIFRWRGFNTNVLQRYQLLFYTVYSIICGKSWISLNILQSFSII